MHAPCLHTRAFRALLAVVAALAATSGLLATTAAPASAGQVGVTVGIRGAGAVSVVEGTIEDGAQLTCQRYDNQDQRVTVWCPRVRNSEVLEAWVWLRATPSFYPDGQWVFDGWSGCDRTREREGAVECAVHSGAFSSDERQPVARFVDTVAPVVSGPVVGPVSGENLTFRFLFTATDGVTDCRVGDLVGWFRCTSGHPVQVPEGHHMFQVRATDPSGNYDLESGTVIAVDTRISSGPAARTNDPSPRFDLHTVGGTGMWCALDGGSWMPCGADRDSTYRLPPVADGEHRLLVQARNGSWVDSVPAEWRWTTDTVAPTTTISVTPNGSTAAVTLTSSETATYECRLERPAGVGSWDPCSGRFTYIGLDDGPHTLSVRATDDVGNVEAPARVHHWVQTVDPDPGQDPGEDPGQDPGQDPPTVPDVPVDTTAPDTALTSGPSGFVLAPTATFGLAGEPGAAFRCTLDGTPVGCGATYVAARLTSGTHVLTAAAVDRAGNVDPTPVVRSWTVPATAAELRAGRGWRSRRDSAAYGGRRLEATRRGATLTRTVRDARQVALVVGKGRGHGSVKVYAGSRLLRTVRLSGKRSVARVLVPVTTFRSPFSGRLRVVVASQGRPVRVEGLGVATG